MRGRSEDRKIGRSAASFRLSRCAGVALSRRCVKPSTGFVASLRRCVKLIHRVRGVVASLRETLPAPYLRPSAVLLPLPNKIRETLLRRYCCANLWNLTR